ncbi:hypothetical protein B0J12DRAFT_309056 [Macrophomina phaseolina]|uniref:Uncharacterized protein n=1 Tax=Macrophomina phaseolina TaxID=35725 RepID=A0ABQ8FZT0_9PEZI|nr:hypothetical protein B0J12DRAFT_309056 [Macrophomina phaseolina]
MPATGDESDGAPSMAERKRTARRGGQRLSLWRVLARPSSRRSNWRRRRAAKRRHRWQRRAMPALGLSGFPTKQWPSMCTTTRAGRRKACAKARNERDASARRSARRLYLHAPPKRIERHFRELRDGGGRSTCATPSALPELLKSVWETCCFCARLEELLS